MSRLFFDMETVNGVDHLFDKIHIVDGEIKGVHAFYYPRHSLDWQHSSRNTITRQWPSHAIGPDWVETIAERIALASSQFVLSRAWTPRAYATL
jgi:hypothetical protein